MKKSFKENFIEHFIAFVFMGLILSVLLLIERVVLHINLDFLNGWICGAIYLTVLNFYNEKETN